MSSYHTQAAMSEQDIEILKIVKELSMLLTPPVELRQIFIRNIAFITTNDELIQAYSRYGPIEKGHIQTEKCYGSNYLKSKGFGFITFYNSESANKAIAEKYIQINGRLVECYLAVNGLYSRPPNAYSK